MVSRPAAEGLLFCVMGMVCSVGFVAGFVGVCWGVYLGKQVWLVLFTGVGLACMVALHEA